jgi:hypothetical protein
MSKWIVDRLQSQTPPLELSPTTTGTMQVADNKFIPVVVALFKYGSNNV